MVIQTSAHVSSLGTRQLPMQQITPSPLARAGAVKRYLNRLHPPGRSPAAARRASSAQPKCNPAAADGTTAPRSRRNETKARRDAHGGWLHVPNMHSLAPCARRAYDGRTTTAHRAHASRAAGWWQPGCRCWPKSPPGASALRSSGTSPLGSALHRGRRWH